METPVHNLREHWESAVSHTRARSPATFDRWFSTVQLDGFAPGMLALRARDAFVRDWVSEHYLPSILQYMRLAAGLALQVHWNLGEIDQPVVPPPGEEAPSSRMIRPSPSRPVIHRPSPSLQRPTAPSPLAPAQAAPAPGPAPLPFPPGFVPAGAPTPSLAPGYPAPSYPPTYTPPLAQAREAAYAHEPPREHPVMLERNASVASAYPAYAPGFPQGYAQQPPQAQPAHAPPAHTQPTHGQPAHAQPGHAAHAQQGHAAHAQQAHAPLAHTGLAPHSQPSHGQPGLVLPAHGQPVHAPASHGQHPQPGHAQQAHGQPAHGQHPPHASVSLSVGPASSPPMTSPLSVRIEAPARPGQPAAPAAPAPEGLNPKYTFENFVVGPSNELAHAAAQASAGGGGRRYSPLFLCGGTGLGKTHLLQAIAYRVLMEQPHKRIIYVSAERFTNEFIAAIQNKRMEAFRAHYRFECDLLLVDDIQFLAGREQTQEEFFHTFNALHELDRPIVFTSDKYPQQLERMEERLVSRFSWGLVADVQAPELETRVAILRKKAQVEGIPLDDHVAIFLAQTVSSNVRELEGTLIRLAAKASLTNRPIDQAFAQGELTNVSSRSRVLSIDDIQRAVCTHFHLRPTDLLSKDRHKTTAFARHVAMYLCKQRLPVSFPEVGRAFGKDHTTVMSAVRKVESLRERDPQVRAHLEAIEKKLSG